MLLKRCLASKEFYLARQATNVLLLSHMKAPKHLTKAQTELYARLEANLLAHYGTWAEACNCQGVSERAIRTALRKLSTMPETCAGKNTSQLLMESVTGFS